jgi:hypothetical protein
MNYEGVWAQTQAECLDKEGLNTRTWIDLSNSTDGKMFDRYEWHCKILNTKGDNKNAILELQCFEFWENLEKNIEGKSSNASLTLESEKSLKIDGVNYVRCTD